MYRSQVRPSAIAIAAVFCGAIGLALLLAFFWEYLGAIGNVVILGVVIRAALIGKLLAWICHRTFFSRPKAVATIAALATLLAIFGALYNGHRLARNQVIAERDRVLEVSADPDKLASHYNEKITNITFTRYVRSYFGFTGQISSDRKIAMDSGASMFGPRIGAALFLLELLLAVLVAAYYSAGVASEPVCARCGHWLREEPQVKAAYGVSSEFIEAMLQASPEVAAQLLTPPDTQEALLLNMANCTSCGEPNGTSHGEPNETARGEPNETACGEPNGTSRGEPNETACGEPNETAREERNETAREEPNETAREDALPRGDDREWKQVLRVRDRFWGASKKQQLVRHCCDLQLDHQEAQILIARMQEIEDAHA